MIIEKGESRHVAKLFGALLMAVGALMVGLCGLCSAVFLVSTVGAASGAIGSMVMLALVFGGVPIAAGVAMFMFGRNLRRGTQSPQS